MNPEIKAMWLDALRSGKYKQAQGVLHLINENEPSYCCLGVLCDLAIKNGVKLDIEHDRKTETLSSVVSYDGMMDMLPKAVMEWSGLETNNGTFTEEFDDGPYGLPRLAELSLAEENDNGTSFEHLANIIEQCF